MPLYSEEPDCFASYRVSFTVVFVFMQYGNNTHKEVKLLARKGKVQIEEKFCKGCSICVEFCPRKVLEMGEDNKAKVKHPDKCNACNLCVLRCPDFSVKVEVLEDE